MRQRRADPQVASLGEVWHGMKEDMRNAPKGLFELIFSKDTFLILTLFVAIPAIYYGGTALLLNYLPARLFGAIAGTVVGDWTLIVLLVLMLGFYFWFKVGMARESRSNGDKQSPGRGVGNGVRIGTDRGRGGRKSTEVIDPEWISLRRTARTKRKRKS